MVAELTVSEKKIVSALATGIAPLSRPWLPAAQAAGCSETELLETLKSFVQRGIVRKVAAVLDSHSMGLEGRWSRGA